MTTIPSPRGTRRARIEIIPLIDIIFFLLATFVMVSLSMTRNLGVPVNLPASATGTPQTREDSAVISVRADGTVLFDKTAVDAGQLRTALEQFARAHSDPRVFINGDAQAEFGKVVAILDEVHAQGITHLAIETRKPER